MRWGSPAIRSGQVASQYASEECFEVAPSRCQVRGRRSTAVLVSNYLGALGLCSLAQPKRKAQVEEPFMGSDHVTSGNDGEGMVELIDVGKPRKVNSTQVMACRIRSAMVRGDQLL